MKQQGQYGTIYITISIEDILMLICINNNCQGRTIPILGLQIVYIFEIN